MFFIKLRGLIFMEIQLKALLGFFVDFEFFHENHFKIQ